RDGLRHVGAAQVAVDGDDVVGHGLRVGKDRQVEPLDDEVARRRAGQERLVDVAPTERTDGTETGTDTEAGGEPARRPPGIVDGIIPVRHGVQYPAGGRLRGHRAGY